MGSEEWFLFLWSNFDRIDILVPFKIQPTGRGHNLLFLKFLNGMFEIIFKIWYMIAVLPFLIFLKGYDMFKEFMSKHGYPLSWIHIVYLLLAILIILLIVLLGNGYPL